MLLIRQGEVTCLARSLPKDILEFSFQSNNGASERLVKLLAVCRLIAQRDTDERSKSLLLVGRTHVAVSENLKYLSRFVFGQHVIVFTAPILECLAQRLESIIGLGTLRVQRLALTQEIAAMFDNVMKCQVNEANISFLIRLHQPLAQMIDSWKALIVIRFGEVRTVENGITLDSPGMSKSIEKIRIGLDHLLLEQLLEKV